MLNRLVWGCYTRHTKVVECGLGVVIQPEDDERVLFFKTDSPDGRACLQIPTTDVICDLVIFVRQQAKNKPTVLFVELKGGDANHAADQIEKTFKAVRNFFPQSSIFSTPEAFAVIVMATSSPPNKQKLIDRLEKIGLKVKLYTGRRNKTVDLHELIR
jgi:hypothetical protein